MIPYIYAVHVNPDGKVEDLSNNILSIQVSKGSEATKSSLTLELQNHDGELNSEAFTIDQSSLTLYMDWCPITSQDPIISTTVSSVSYPVSNEGKYTIKVKGTDKTGLFLSKVWAYAIQESFGWDSPTAVINVVGHLNDSDSDYSVTLTTNNVATVRSDGSAFPTGIALSKIWKPGFEWIRDLSQQEYTGETLPYVYFVDQNNDLHWHYPYQKDTATLSANIDISQTTIPVSSASSYPSSGNIIISSELVSYTGKTSTSFTGCTRGAYLTSASAHTSGDVVSGEALYLGREDIYKMSIGTTQDASYNFIIFNGGRTPAGFELLGYLPDYSQRGRSFRMKFFDWKGVGKTMTNDEKGRPGWGTDKSTSYPQPGDSPLGAGNPYTPLWTTTAVTSNSGYHDAFKTELTKRCNAEANGYFGDGKQKFKASIQMRGNTQYVVNEIVTVTSPKFSADGATILSKLLRVKDVKHQLNKSSWITDLELEEDPNPINVT